MTAAVSVTHTTPVRRLLSLDFRFEADDATLVDHLTRAWSHLPGGDPSVSPTVYGIVGAGGGYRPVVDGAGDETYRSASQAMGMAMWRLNQDVAKSAGADTVVLHAAVAVQDERAVVICAPPDHGKSTLVVGLAQRGLAYAGDEFAPLDLRAGLLTPVPRPPVLEGPALRLLPDLEPPCTFSWFAEQWLVDPGRLAGGVTTDPVSPVLVVVPSYVPNAKLEVQELARSAAVTHLLGQVFNMPAVQRAGFRAVVNLVRHCRAVSIVSSDLEATCNVVLEWMDRDA
jgi:hypothetical protein